jgi:hypothetical protein
VEAFSLMEAKFHRKVKSKIQKKSDFEGFQLSEFICKNGEDLP